MLDMMPLSRHALSLQTRLHRQSILGTVIPPTAAGAWTSARGSHMLSKCDHLTNLTRYHNLPHLNLESRISLTLYSSWSSTMMGLGCRGCGHSATSSGM